MVIKLRFSSHPLNEGDWLYYVYFQFKGRRMRSVFNLNPGSSKEDVSGIINSLPEQKIIPDRIDIIPTEEGIYSLRYSTNMLNSGGVPCFKTDRHLKKLPHSKEYNINGFGIHGISPALRLKKPYSFNEKIFALADTRRREIENRFIAEELNLSSLAQYITRGFLGAEDMLDLGLYLRSKVDEKEVNEHERYTIKKIVRNIKTALSHDSFHAFKENFVIGYLTV